MQKSKCPLQLEGKTTGGSQWVVPVSTTPFRIGRKEGCNLHLVVEGVSRIHAEIKETGDGWRIMDCGSTNGTFVNSRRVTGEQLLKPGDILQFADLFFTVTEFAEASEHTQIINPHALRFEGMMIKKAVTPYFQPIVNFSDLRLAGYEALGRVHYDGLPEAPGALFQIARRLGREVELSQLFREEAFACAGRMNMPGVLFFNMLPGEVNVEEISVSLAQVRRDFPSLRLAMELHEGVVTNVPMIRKLHQVLKDLGIFLVYDDFGSGQARLVELIEAPPDVIKFDISLVHGIETRSATSQSIVAALVKMAREAGIAALAEGVESREEADVCKQLGFDFAQGFFFGRPAPLPDEGGDAGPVA
ncbi:MAG: EAL domain-containing protein [Deltaproteobacteria bacterium]|nr:EAL domain-containing protein [Deltaproteobacteria bacterium]